MERMYTRLLRLGVMALFFGAIAFVGCSDEPTKPDPDPVDPGDTTTIDKRKRPVVFVHGAMEAADMFTQLTQLMMRNGYTDAQINAEDFELFMNENGIVDIDKMATAVKSRVDALTASTGEARVDIVAHGAGAKAVQKYLATLGGTAKIAQVVYAGPEYDLSITVNGDPTPPPCKYLTLRSNGKDALQLGDANYGSLAGAQNEVLADHDNRQLASSTDAFAKIYAFFTGAAPAVTKLPATKPGQPYVLRGRVIDFIDNTGIAGATVISIKIRKNTDGTYQRITGGPSATSDASGYFQFTDNVSPDSHIELLVRPSSATHYDMHIYRQPWRDDSKTERVRMVPRSGGSTMLTAFSAALRTGTHANAIVYTQNQSLHHGRDNMLVKRFNPGGESIGDVQVLTSGNAPAAGTSGSGMNTFFMCLLDYDMNGQDGSGPVAAGILNMFGINSFDILLDASATNYQTTYVLNNLELATFNYRSNGATGSNNAGFNMIQYEYVP
jgi:pimeloyl-ACP methyl ester carboxylesterase